jgi:phosphatidylethanolamine/phosphatidyl-N-methylethanolamine N-methyltransferase
MTKPRPSPSKHDLEIWSRVKGEFLDWGYTGLIGYLQAAGHRLINRWAGPYADKVVVEIGCGRGHHLRYGGNRYPRYVGLDIECELLRTLRQRFPGTMVVNGDAYSLPFRDASVDCVLSIYCFEHLRQLPDCLAETRRVLKPGGVLLVGLPAEGGLLYEIGRQLTTKRHFERQYGIDYDAIVHWEHCNTFDEVVEKLQVQFKTSEQRFIPFPFVPTVHGNVFGCLRAAK